MTTFEQFRALPLDKSLLALEEGDPGIRYFCYPEGAAAIGYEGAILYCFLEGTAGRFSPAIRKAAGTSTSILWRRIFSG